MESANPDTSPPTVPHLPPIVAITTVLGLIYAVGGPFPNLPPEGSNQINATIEAITEAEDDDDETGTRYLIRASDPSLGPGYCWQERMGGSLVVSLARATPQALLDAAERQDENDKNAGIDVRRVLARFGPLTICFEEGRNVPELPGLPPWYRGKVGRIFRTDGGYRVAVAVEPQGPIEPGTVLVIMITQAVSGLEVLPEIEALDHEEKARVAQLEALEALLSGEEEEGEEGEEEREEPAK